MTKFFLSFTVAVGLMLPQVTRADALQDLTQLRTQVIEDQDKVAKLCIVLVGSPHFFTCHTLSFVYSGTSGRVEHLSDLLVISGRMKSSEDRAFVDYMIGFWTRFSPDYNRAALGHLTAVLADSQNVSVSMYADKLSSQIKKLQQISESVSAKK